MPSGTPGATARRWLRRLLPQWLQRVFRIGRDLGFRAGAIHLRRQLARAWGSHRRRAAQATQPVRSLIFICHGNIIRSPFAAALLRKLLAGGEVKIHVSSAGLQANPAQGADPRVRALAPRLGISLEEHRATPLTAAMVEENDLLLVMDYRNEAELLARFPNARRKVWLLREYVWARGKELEIPDPYLGGETEVQRVCEELHRCVVELTRRLYPGGS